MAKKTLTQAAYDVDNVQGLADQVKNQAALVKQTFDKTGSDAKTYNNNTLLVELQSETPNDSGAHAIGLNTANTVADNVADELDLIRQAGSGTIPPDDSITLAKQNSTVKTGLLADLDTINKSTFKDAINEVNGKVLYGNTVNGTDALAITTVNGDFTFAVGEVVKGIATNNNTTSMTVDVDSDGALPIKKLDGSSYVDVEEDDFEENKPFELIGQNDGVIGDFFLLAPKGGGVRAIYGVYTGSDINIMQDGKGVGANEYVYCNENTLIATGTEVAKELITQITSDAGASICQNTQIPKGGQTFTLSQNANKITCAFQIGKVGNPTGTITAKLALTSNGLPTTVIASSTESYDAAMLPTTSFPDRVFTFVGVELVAGTYAVYLESTGAPGADYISANVNTNNPYAGGTVVYLINGSWDRTTYPTWDFYFKVNTYQDGQLIPSVANATSVSQLKVIDSGTLQSFGTTLKKYVGFVSKKEVAL